ncbi:hypothetical protein J1N35_025232 [Gossypium stocksii]|uniref:Reverse transcriptase Ty1/copia-type domain-containing protein n=1 Tax=Gossypium stocksii TaxID=47602 RepID=A0A9D3ZXL6_9ROSI|nr:hypothetical protein J1N35_025232 [Gossypium stocksii]
MIAHNVEAPGAMSMADSDPQDYGDAPTVGGDGYNCPPRSALEQRADGGSWGQWSHFTHQVNPSPIPAYGYNQAKWAANACGSISGPLAPDAARPYYGPYARPPQPSAGHGPSYGLGSLPTAPHEVPWQTMRHARVFDVDNSQCIGLPRIPDFLASDFLDVSQYDSNCGSAVPYVHLPIGTTSWYPDSNTSHHVCQNVADLNATTPYSSTSELLMGNGAPTKIYSVGNMFTLCHNRLGDLSSKVVNDVLNKCGIISIKKSLFNVYVTCQKGKSHKLPFLHSTTEYVETFELVISKLWGPASVDCEGNLYYISFYWGYAFCSAVHLINRLPTVVLQAQSPYQKLYGSQPCTFLGYSSQHKGYFCLTLDRKVVVSRHIVLDEGWFLYVSPVMNDISGYSRSTTYVPVVTSSSSPIPAMPHPSDVVSSSSSLPGSKHEVVPAVSPHSAVVSSSSSLPRSAHEVVCSDFIMSFAPFSLPKVMVTQSKAGIFKPKALSVEVVDFEQSTMLVALAHLEWRLAVQAEYNALMANSTWDLESLPSGQKVIGYKWLFKIKRNHDGSVNRRKARLVAKGCSQVPRSDASLFVRVISDSILYILVYVDDITIISNVSIVITRFVEQLNAEFSLKDMGDLHYFLGIEVTRSSTRSIHLCKKKYIRDLLVRSSLLHAKPVHTLMVSLPNLSKDDGDRLCDPTEYRSLAGALQYVMLTRLDIAYTVNRICQFMHSPTTTHMTALKRILRYLCGTLDYGIVFRPSTQLSLVGYADANWGLDFDNHRSTSGFCVYFGDVPISWCSKKQQVVFRSTTEAEYRGLAAATSDIIWLISLLQELQVHSVDTPTVWCDSSSVIAVAANPVLHSKFKHVELDLFFVHEKVANGSIIVGEVPTCDQVADGLTKPLFLTSFTRFRNVLQVLPVEKMDAC